MTTLDELITELQTFQRLSAIESGIAELNERIANHRNSPERLARTLSLSARLNCFLTGESRLAYLPTPRVWLSKENGQWRTRSNAQVATMLRHVLKLDGRSITKAEVAKIEKAARVVFARAELPGGTS